MRLLAILLLALTSGPLKAACDAQPVTDPSRVRLKGDTLMIVTHASSAYDPRLSSKRGIDEATRFAKAGRIPLVYLRDDEPESLLFTEDCRPDFWIRAQDGEVAFEFEATHVYVAGGHLELCLSRTLHDVLAAWAKRPGRSLTVTFVMDAIYSNGKSVDANDRYYRDFERFIGVVTHARPGGERWPKLTLLETMGIIGRQSDQLEYLKRVVPHFGRTMPRDYRVELRLNDAAGVLLSPGAGRSAPTLRFHFVDAAGAPALAADH